MYKGPSWSWLYKGHHGRDHIRGCHGLDRMVVEFTNTCVISAYLHLSCEFESHSWQGVLNTTLCDKVCQ